MELHEWAPWLLSTTGLVHPWLLGKRKRSGWLFAVFNASCGAVYNIITEQYGFLPLIFFSIAMYVMNYLNWRRESDAQADGGQQNQEVKCACSQS